jgi:hypothetical protein
MKCTLKHSLHCLYHVFIYIYSLLIKKDICDCQLIFRVFVCAFRLEILSIFW